MLAQDVYALDRTHKENKIRQYLLLVAHMDDSA